MDITWQKEWTIDEDVEGLGLPDLVHTSGLAFRMVFTEVDEAGWMGWVPMDPDGRGSTNEAVRKQLGQQRMARLYEEAQILWMSLGYFEHPQKVSTAPFGPDWRMLWRSDEGEPGELWIRHESGLRLELVKLPAGGIEQSWGVRPDARGAGMKQRMVNFAGQQAWDQLEDQAMTFFRELARLGDQARAHLH